MSAGILCPSLAVSSGISRIRPDFRLPPISFYTPPRRRRVPGLAPTRYGLSSTPNYALSSRVSRFCERGIFCFVIPSEPLLRARDLGERPRFRRASRAGKQSATRASELQPLLSPPNLLPSSRASRFCERGTLCFVIPSEPLLRARDLVPCHPERAAFASEAPGQATARSCSLPPCRREHSLRRSHEINIAASQLRRGKSQAQLIVEPEQMIIGNATFAIQ
jgi:hypothetical protein